MTWINRYGDPQLPAMVFLHGFMGAKEDWQPMMAKISQYFHCICIDLPGHGGNSFTLPHPGLFSAAEHIIQTVNNLGYTEFHLVGYSLGGRIALQVARIQPQAILSLTLESAHPGLLSDDEKKQRAINDNNWADKLLSQPFEHFVQQWYQQAVFSDLSDKQRHFLISKRLSNQPKSLHACYLATSLSLQQDCRNVVEKLTCRCAFIAGEQDKKFQHLAHNWQQSLHSGASLQLVIIAGVGHNIHSMQPHIFSNTLLSLLRDEPTQ
ncbi:2-succinyl-6-hydroxy-2,4-cyclohexadiene-1-carboxylate synthase [Shewanella subflava]|uniref:Putative 2-succinyl-6-hydroxy-2,4-cyclohexadiene-1-carboxylate synthase n=1 Tax=Shewanella subflava TaxID=2986476 RepID=A0ABT3I823_9GAMM|nr:2-succinyl-6-hydroxy-2,4-cyclohexadiene-1-carboxylate synthase [Shewanella subflava]MCW3172104.1 2-succinyl-6-hydroxy-2,4-cyclohexadiene-1-carboxylate synthase [Shewanella subflava]